MLWNPQTYVSRKVHPIGKRRSPINVIKLKPDIKTCALSTSRRVPVPLLTKVKEELSRMKQMQIISKVDEPTEWSVGMVAIPKATGKVRMNEDHTLAQLTGATVFSIIEANSGFWQIGLFARVSKTYYFYLFSSEVLHQPPTLWDKFYP